MTEQNTQQQIFEYLKESVNKIGDFASKEIPPFVDEYLAWKFMEAGFDLGTYLLLFIPFVIISIIWFRKTVKTFDRFFDRGETFPWGITTFTLVSLFLMTVMIPYSAAKTMVQIKVAPKVYLLEQASEFLK